MVFCSAVALHLGWNQDQGVQKVFFNDMLTWDPHCFEGMMWRHPNSDMGFRMVPKAKHFPNDKATTKEKMHLCFFYSYHI